MKTNGEQPVHISMEQSAINYAGDRNKGSAYGYPSYTANLIEKGFVAGWQEREQPLLPIIKEMGETLKEIQKSCSKGSVINTYWMQIHIETTLDKYKNYL